MAHDVRFSIPSRKLGVADVEFEVWSNGVKHGTFRVSKGSIVWFPFMKKHGYRMGWSKFQKVMMEHATSFEKK